MTLSLTANWLAEFRRGAVAPVVYLVTIDIGTGITYTTRRGWSADATVSAYTESLSSISQVTATLDPFTRLSQVSQCELTFANDGWIRTLAVSSRLKGKSLTVTVGTENLSQSDFAPYFKGEIDQLLPRSDGTAVARCSSAFARLRDKQIVGYWAPQHPLSVIQDIYTKAEIPTSLYSSTTLDPSQAQYSPISHWVIQRGAFLINGVDGAIRRPVSALKLIEEIGLLLDGQNIEHEDGRLAFTIYDSSASAVDAWTDDDIVKESLSVVDLESNAFNQISVDFIKTDDSTKDSGYEVQYYQDDTASQAALAYPGESGRILNQHYSTEWLDHFGDLQVTMTETSPAPGEYIESDAYGCSGTYYPGFTADGTPPEQPAYAQATSSRVVYLKIDNEVVECDQLLFGGRSIHPIVVDPSTGSEIRIGEFPERIAYRVKARGALGTAVAAHTGYDTAVAGPWARVHDITIAVSMAATRLRRWSYGAPVVKLATPLSKHSVQLGDFVTLSSTASVFFAFGKSSLAGDKWEVVGKDADFASGTITWTLCFVAAVTPTTRHSVFPGGPITTTRARALNALDGTTHAAKVTGGFSVSASSESGMSVDIGPGVAQIGDVTRISRSSAQTVRLAPNKDNYVILNTLSGAIGVRPVASGGTPPTLTTGQVLLSKATTSSVSITQIKSSPPASTFAPSTVAPVHVDVKGASGISLNPNPFMVHRTRG
jgi:hypothetical protein